MARLKEVGATKETIRGPNINKGSKVALDKKGSRKDAVSPEIETAKDESSILSQPKPSAKVTKKEEKKVFVDSYDLPASYNTTDLTLIARDPHWIHAYWQIARDTIEDLRSKIGNDIYRSSYVLRMYDVTCINFTGNNANSWFDIEVGTNINSWYINLWCDNVTYCGEIGIRTPDGRFFPLTRSNVVTTPRLNPSDRSDQIWMEVKDGQPAKPFIRVDTQKRKTAVTSRAVSKIKKIFLTEDDIRVYYSKLFPLLKLIISARRSRGWSALDIEFLRSYLKDQRLLDDVLRRGLSKSQFIKRILVGSSEEMVLRGGASEQVGGASEREQKKRKFFFEIGTELIVYGRTEPDAEVWLGEKKIKLRDDGTFTLRFALPDGKIPLDFTAQSHDKVDKRIIKTAVERTKTLPNP